MFKDNLNRICKERGTKLTPVMIALGYSSSKATAINKGQIPKEDVLEKLSTYLDCTVADFFTAENQEQTPTLTEDETDIIEVFRSLSRRQKHEFMVSVYEFKAKTELEKNRQSVAV